MNSGIKVLPKGLRCSIVSKIMTRMLTFRDPTTDVTYSADVALFLHTTSGGLSQTAAFSLRWFLAFHCFKCYLASFPRYKTAFLSNIMPPKHAEQDQIDTKWLENKLVFWRESRRVDWSVIIVIKRNRKFDFFQCKIEFYCTHEHQNLYFHSLLLVFIRWNKIWSYTEKKTNILYKFAFTSCCCQ